jgi:DUF1365 family protein
MMESAIYSGFIAHTRHIPKQHSFNYPFFMWFLDLDDIDNLKDLGRWFSVKRWALSRFRRADYFGDPARGLADCVREELKRITGHGVEGKVCGLLNLRTAGLYFSPVNFYYGFDGAGKMSHLLAEVSNTPWNERHCYGHYLGNDGSVRENPKNFKVSPFNPSTNQTYRWKIENPGKKIAINLGLHDVRGHIFEAALRLDRMPFSVRTVRRQLLKKPIMTVYIIFKIYWQALKIFVKRIPYVPYHKENV